MDRGGQRSAARPRTPAAGYGEQPIGGHVVVGQLCLSDTVGQTAVYTWDVFSTLDGYGSYAEGADWGGYWGKQGPELLEHRAALFNADQRMVFGATTFRETAQIMSSGIEPDEWAVRTMRMPATVISSTLQDTLGWPDATIVSGDAVDIVARLKQESDVPLRSQASLSLNWALMAAGLVDRLQVTIFPVISGRTGTSPRSHEESGP